MMIAQTGRTISVWVIIIYMDDRKSMEERVRNALTFEK